MAFLTAKPLGCAEFVAGVNELKGHLINRGYNEDEVQTQINKATGLDRSTLLQSTKDKTPLERVPLIVTYHPGLPPLKSILNKHLPILNVSHHLSSAVKDPPLVAYRCPCPLPPPQFKKPSDAGEI